MDIRIATMHSAFVLEIRHADQLAEAFFRYDPSSAHKRSYDAWITGRDSPANRIVIADVTAINTTMAARSPTSQWTQFTQAGSDMPELVALDPTWDLFMLPDEEWQTLHCRKRIEHLLTAVMGPWRNLAVATKVLHVKRPALIPVLDSYVVQMLGGPAIAVATTGADVIAHLRAQGRANLGALQAIQMQLIKHGYQRTLVRILDALLWLSHPGAWGSAAYKHIQPMAAVIEVR